MISESVIDPVVTEWAARILYASKKDSLFRFFVAYRKLNVVILRDSYPLPRVKELIYSPGEATMFFTLHASSGYFQIKIDEYDR